jgi:hypothetical protein
MISHRVQLGGGKEKPGSLSPTTENYRELLTLSMQHDKIAQWSWQLSKLQQVLAPDSSPDPGRFLASFNACSYKTL